MANNRMQLYCKKCLEAFSLAKYSPVSWGTPVDNSYLNSFFEKHDACFMNAEEDFDVNGGCDMYGFRTENDEDGFITLFNPYRIKQK